ncbi:hypothetical protein NQZ68_029319 [Dissostichus eleginoides]|nr:hypothetical protein NQZ68_029319 [Dissostichus eleginoides]
MKEEISKEIKDFRMDLNEFRAGTDKDIKKIRQLTTELRTDQRKTSDRVDQVERHVSAWQDVTVMSHQGVTERGPINCASPAKGKSV